MRFRGGVFAIFVAAILAARVQGAESADDAVAENPIHTPADGLQYLSGLRQRVSDGLLVLIRDPQSGATLPINTADYMRVKRIHVRISSHSPRETQRRLAQLQIDLEDLRQQNLQWIDREIARMRQGWREPQ